MKCLICNTEQNQLGKHLWYKHHLTSKEYYDKFLKTKENICPVCGRKTPWLRLQYGYQEHCSSKCAAIDPTTRENYAKSMLEKYNVTSNFKRQITKDNSHNQIAQEKYKQTLIDKYGVDSNWKRSEIIQKNHSEEALQKREQTMLVKYGVVHIFTLDSVYEKSHSRQTKLKAIKTMRQNGHYSKLEDLFEANLISLGYMQGIDFEFQYKSDVYPYYCDFYLINENEYIEINGYWTHGGHLFDETNDDDRHKFELWKSKAAQGLKQYQTAINVWTKYDVEKYQTAVNNSLNYIILWNEHDILEYFKQKAGKLK